jgi:hypothetical protein
MSPPSNRYGRPANWPVITAPPGRYCIEDPDRPGRWTAWKITEERDLHRFPPGTRWEPRYPDLSHISDREKRAELRHRWYAETYWPWKIKIVHAINANPATAAAEFAHQFAALIAAEQAHEALREQRRQLEARYRRWQEIRAGDMVRCGTSVRKVATQLGVSRQTAEARVKAGVAAWEQDPDGCRAYLEEMLAELLNGSTVLGHPAPVSADPISAPVAALRGTVPGAGAQPAGYDGFHLLALLVRRELAGHRYGSTSVTLVPRHRERANGGRPAGPRRHRTCQLWRARGRCECVARPSRGLQGAPQSARPWVSTSRLGCGAGVSSLCPLCPPRRRRGRHHRGGRYDGAQACEECRQMLCSRHVAWVDERWVCARCQRVAGRAA